MARANPITASLARGEVSPLLYGRVDLAAYQIAARTLLNFISRTQGPAQRRSGFRFVKEVKDSAKQGRLASFEFSVTQAYVIEMADFKFRFFRDEGIIESAPAVPLELTSVYPVSVVYDIKTAQSADTMYLAHPTYPPYKLTRTSHTAWTLTAIDFIDGPFIDENTTATTLTPSATTGNITITASAATGINGGSGFLSTDVGRLVRIKHTATWGTAKITAITTNVLVDATVQTGHNFGAATAQTTWRLGAWSGTTGYPGAVCFHEERLWWGGSTDYPQTVWASRSADFETMSPTDTAGTVGDDSAITFTLAANQVNVIRWLAPQNVLLIGTVGGLWVLKSSSLDSPLTPTNVQTRLQRSQGCANIEPVPAGDAILFVTRSRRKLRELVYAFERDKFVSPDMTILSEHITSPGIQQIAFAEEPDPIVWCARDDGVLAGFTYERDQEVTAWHRHIVGGEFGAGDAVVESVATIPAPDGSHNQLWIIVKRTINGQTKRYVEFMEEMFSETHAQANAFFVDSGLTYDGAPATVISGLDHLEGEPVQILADGATHPERIVASGSITLDNAASVVHVGLEFDADFENLRPEAGATIGTAQGQTKRIHGVTIRFLRTLGGSIGPDEDHLDEILYREGDDPMDSPPPLFTGDKFVSLDKGYDPDGYFLIRQDQPLPMTLQIIAPRLVTSER